ncbi:hypothetical protein [Actinomadura monticuli]|uniref:Uncharacterized protein n=1 Tax=Actinomadura monticuli TaxID=3097367 RepID=A0ABV4QC60_9ACTN
MHGSQEDQSNVSTTAGAGDVSGIALSEAALAYLDERLAQGLVAPASAHDHSTVNEPSF